MSTWIINWQAMALPGQSIECFVYFALGLLLAVLLVLNKPVRNEFIYWYKYVLYFSLQFIVMTSYCFVFIFRPCNIKNFLLLRPHSLFISWTLGISHHVRCKEDIKEEGAIVVMNHQNSMDNLTFLNITSTLKKCALVSKRELFFLGTFGLGLWLSGVIPLNRRNNASALKTLANMKNLMKKNSAKMAFFVEGTRNMHVNKTRKLLPFKKGAFYLAIECEVPIIPVVISPYLFIRGAPQRFFGTGTTVTEVLPAIPTKGMKLKDVPVLMEKTYTVMQKKYDELYDEAERLLESSGF